MRWQVIQQPRLAFRLEHLARRVKQIACPDADRDTDWCKTKKSLPAEERNYRAPAVHRSGRG
jgi:hypothetical protein